MLFIYVHNVYVTLYNSSELRLLDSAQGPLNNLKTCLLNGDHSFTMARFKWLGQVKIQDDGQNTGYNKFNGSHCWKFGCRRLSERYQRLEYEDFDNKEVPSNVPLASSSSFFTVARTNFLCTCIQVFRKIYKSTSKFILIIKMYVFIYEAPNMSTETLQFPLDIPKYLLPSLPIVKLPCNEKTSTY